jgi:hypothetical protein
MKDRIIYHLVCLALLTLSLHACGKEDVGPERNYEFGGEATALKDGAPWKAEIMASQAVNQVTEFNMQLFLYDSKSLLLEVVSIGRLKPQIEKQTLYNPNFTQDEGRTEAYYYTLIDDDVTDDRYNVDESKTNYLQILEYDTVNSRISGIFEIHHLIERDGRFTEGDPEVSFTSGEFVTEVNPEWFE